MAKFTSSIHVQPERLKGIRAVEENLSGRLNESLVEDFGWDEGQIESWRKDRDEGPESLVEIYRHYKR